MGTISPKELDAKFKHEVASVSGGEHVKRCLACGACSGGCLIAETTSDFDPRKIIRMITFGMKDKVLSSHMIWQCLLCHNCSFHCPQDVNFAEVVGALRYMAVKAGYVHPPFLQNFAFHALLPSQARLEFVTRPVTLAQAIKLPTLVRNSKVLNLFPERVRGLEKLLPDLPMVPLRQQLKTVTPAKGEAKHRVGFFMGCVDNLVFTSAARTAVSLLSDNSCEVVTPKKSVCCGMPFSGYGEPGLMRKMAKRNIDVFETTQSEYVITDCATCGSFLKGYGEILKDDPGYAKRAVAFSKKVQDISEFLVKTIGIKQELREVKGKVTYHDSCHMTWSQGLWEQPRQLLKMIPGLEFVEMKESNTCCGGAGIYNLTHYEKSMEILDRKMANIAATGADLIASGCPGCRLQLGLGVKRRGLNARVVHPIELLAKACKED